MKDMTPENVKAALSYDPDSGDMLWRVNTSSTGRAGQPAGCARKDLRRVVRLFGKLYLAHRLAFLIQLGRWPAGEVDHIDGNPGNNAWANLREATRSQNAANSKTRKDSSLGTKGVWIHKPTGKFQAQISAQGQVHCLGLYDSLKDARAAYRAAALQFHGEFARPSTLGQPE